MCNFAVKETTNYYNTRGSDVHVALLDATNAFDLINCAKLFTELLNKYCCLKVLKYVYTTCQIIMLNLKGFLLHTVLNKVGCYLHFIQFTSLCHVKTLCTSRLGC